MPSAGQWVPAESGGQWNRRGGAWGFQGNYDFFFYVEISKKEKY